MSHDGVSARAETGASETRADRRASSLDADRHATHAGRRLASVSALAAAAIVVIAACSSTGSSPSGQVAGATGTPETASVEPSLEASPSASAPTAINVSFQEANGSQIFGGGILSDLGDGTTAVTLGLVATNFKDPLPAVLEQGACADLAAAASGSPGASESAAASAEASAEPSAAPSKAAASAGASAGASASAAAPSVGLASPVAGP